jgi:hypothetical protein
MQVRGFVPRHTPPWQLSVWVHALPSLQEAPSASVVKEVVLTSG